MSATTGPNQESSNPVTHDYCEFCEEDEAHYQVRAYHHGTQQFVVKDLCSDCTTEIFIGPLLHPMERHNCILYESET